MKKTRFLGANTLKRSDWSLIRQNQQIHILPETPSNTTVVAECSVKVEYGEEPINEVQIGDNVTVAGITGELLCASTTGVQVLSEK